MKKIFAIAVALSALACSTLNAASIKVVTTGAVSSLFLNGGTDNNNFDAVDLLVTPAPGTQFANPSNGNNAGVPRPAGDPFTYTNRLLGADPNDVPGGLNWTILGLTQTADKLAFGGGPLGLKIDTSGQPGGDLFLANVMLAPGATAMARVQVISAGNILSEFNQTIPIPEPASVMLTGAGLLGLLGLRRRQA
jgi:hypothetical protein